MRLQDFIADQTTAAAEELGKQVQKMGDKATWSALDEGRTALDQLAECAVIGGYLVDVIANKHMPPMDEAMWTQYMTDKGAVTSVAQGAELLQANTAKLCGVIRAVADTDLGVMMSFWGPEPWPVSKVMAHHLMNVQYHVGQVNYIQTLYGDKEMG
jgi:hypothetical protein